jgi:hypothetical protein
MKWKNAIIDKPPQSGQDVLICVNGVYYIATFDSEIPVFKLKEEPTASFDPNEHLIYWTEFTNPK